jgi:hypothetical protein
MRDRKLGSDLPFSIDGMAFNLQTDYGFGPACGFSYNSGDMYRMKS